MFKIVIKNTVLSNDKTQICVPLVGKTDKEIFDEINIIKKKDPDIIEWRSDFYEDVTDIKKTINCLNNIHSVFNDKPIIFTLRSFEEGGQQKFDNEKRLFIIKEVIKSKKIDLIDIELINSKLFLEEVITFSKKNNIKIIISNHNFNITPSYNDIINTLDKMNNLETDVVKIAYMPKNKNDVINLINATNYFNQNHNKLIISISMSKLGIITRIGANIFGSCLTFASGVEQSAPGQIDILKLRTILNEIL